MTAVSAPGALAYQVVDVFTDVPYAGNPLAVVLDADDLSAAQMQRVAQEFALSETAFVVAPHRADYRIRIFTPAAELPFAGHPSVGSAWVLRRLGRLPAGGVVQECGAGEVELVVTDDGATLTGATPSWRGEVDPGPLLEAVGLTPADLDGTAGQGGCGIDFTYLPVLPGAVARAVPDLQALRRLPLATGLSVSSWDGANAATRVFVPDVGIPEDPATGAAALGYGVFLTASGRVGNGATPYVVRQGVEIGRPSVLSCEVRVAAGVAEAVTVRGRVVPVATGEIRRPPP